MADQKITDRPELTTPAPDDWMHTVDVSDLTDGADGTSKKIKRSNTVAGVGKGIVNVSNTHEIGDGSAVQFIWDALVSNANGANITMSDVQVILEKLSSTTGNGAKVHLMETLLRLQGGNHYIDLSKADGLVFSIEGLPPTIGQYLTVIGKSGNEARIGYVDKISGGLVTNLPAGTTGDKRYITDALTPTHLGTAVGGGAITCPVFFDGTNWIT